MTTIRSAVVPVGVWIDAGGLAVNLSSRPTRDFIKACNHVIDLMENKTTYNELPVGDIHPGIKQYLDSLKRKD